MPVWSRWTTSPRSTAWRFARHPTGIGSGGYVRDNTSLETDRLLATPVEARYVRLLVTKPDQSEGNTTRIYEFSVY